MNYKRVRCPHSNIMFDLLFLIYRILPSTTTTLFYIQFKKDTVVCETVQTVRLRLKQKDSQFTVKTFIEVFHNSLQQISQECVCVKLLLRFGEVPWLKN